MSDGPAKIKSYAFALKVVNTVREIQQEQKEFVLSKQLLRAGTSIGANVAEAGAGQSKRDFVAKMAIASKEARESFYWLRLLRDSKILEQNLAQELIADVEELIRILTSIVKTAQNKLERQQPGATKH